MRQELGQIHGVIIVVLRDPSQYIDEPFPGIYIQFTSFIRLECYTAGLLIILYTVASNFQSQQLVNWNLLSLGFRENEYLSSYRLTHYLLNP